jgi:DNA-binding NarL/FixJ family response regulator
VWKADRVPESATQGRRVLVVDDHPMFREGIRAVLEDAGFVVAGEAGNPRDALAMIHAGRSDVALLDLSLGAESGLSLMGPLRTKGIPAIVCSMHDDRLHVEQALTAGASAYVTKDDSPETLVTALRSVLRGRPFVSRRTDVMMTTEVAPLLRVGHAVRLSRREQQVLEYLSSGFAVSDIAQHLSVSPRTVEAYANRLMTKLGLSGMRELRRYAATAGRSVA